MHCLLNGWCMLLLLLEVDYIEALESTMGMLIVASMQPSYVIQ